MHCKSIIDSSSISSGVSSTSSGPSSATSITTSANLSSSSAISSSSSYTSSTSSTSPALLSSTSSNLELSLRENKSLNDNDDDSIVIDNVNGKDIIDLFKLLDKIIIDKEEEILLLDDNNEQNIKNDEVEKIKKQINILRSQFIEAQRYSQISKMVLIENKRKELFFSSSSSSGLGTGSFLFDNGDKNIKSSTTTPSKPKGADLINKSKQINYSLERTNRLLSQELERMNQIGGIIQEDSKTFEELSSEYDKYNASVKSSKSMLQSMKMKAMTDKFQIYAAIGFFLLVIAYILLRRFRYLISPFVWIAKQLFYFYSSFIHPLIFPEDATNNEDANSIITSSSNLIDREDL